MQQQQHAIRMTLTRGLYGRRERASSQKLKETKLSCVIHIHERDPVHSPGALAARGGPSVTRVGRGRGGASVRGALTSSWYCTRLGKHGHTVEFDRGGFPALTLPAVTSYSFAARARVRGASVVARDAVR